MTTTTTSDSLFFDFRGERVPVFHPGLPVDHAEKAIACDPFRTWVSRCERDVAVLEAEGGGSSFQYQRLNLHSVEFQSIDMFGARGVGFIKLKSNCTLSTIEKDSAGLIVKETRHEKPLPGICFLRGSAVSILVALFCGDEVYSLLVDQPRIPIGQASCLEIPAGMVDDENESVAGIAVQEMREECSIHIEKTSELVDLTELALKGHATKLPSVAIPPSPGGCDEVLKCFYLEKKVTEDELSAMKGRLQGLRDHGEYITLRVVPFDQVWKVSGDAKAMVSLFLLDQLRKDGKLPEAGSLATPLSGCGLAPEQNISCDQKLGNFAPMPRMAFGLYKIPADADGESIIYEAIAAGYRHFDGGEFYGNEECLGRAIQKSGIPRTEFYITGKVWKDSMAAGPNGVRNSVQNSLTKLQFSQADSYFDLVLLHWPVPGHNIESYETLQEMYRAGKIKALGLSNFNQDEYKDLMASGKVTVPPICNQMEVSAIMYRPEIIEFFQNKGMIVLAFKPLNRGSEIILQDEPFVSMAKKYRVTVPQLLLRWCIQHDLAVACKSSSIVRMRENRNVWHFRLSDSDMDTLDQLTKAEDVVQRTERERASKCI